jgi:hypothetical protein
LSKGKVIVRHKVRDFNAWKPFFLGDVKRQRDSGFTAWHVMRNKNDMNEVVVIFESEDLDKAIPMFSDPSLHELMKKAGVVDEPTVFILTEAESGTL